MCKVHIGFERLYVNIISHVIPTKLNMCHLETRIIYSKSIDVMLQETAYIEMTSGAFEDLIKIAFGLERGKKL